MRRFECVRVWLTCVNRYLKDVPFFQSSSEEAVHVFVTIAITADMNKAVGMKRTFETDRSCVRLQVHCTLILCLLSSCSHFVVIIVWETHVRTTSTR